MRAGARGPAGGRGAARGPKLTFVLGHQPLERRPRHLPGNSCAVGLASAALLPPARRQGRFRVAAGAQEPFRDARRVRGAGRGGRGGAGRGPKPLCGINTASGDPDSGRELCRRSRSSERPQSVCEPPVPSSWPQGGPDGGDGDGGSWTEDGDGGKGGRGGRWAGLATRGPDEQMSFRLFAEGTPWTVSGLPRCHPCSSEEATFRPSCSQSENPRGTHLVPRWLPSHRFRFEKVRLAIVAVLCRVGVVLDSTRPREELWELEVGAEQRPDPSPTPGVDGLPSQPPAC